MSIITNGTNNTWIDCGNYWEFNAEQGTDEWLEGRKGRVTGSVAGPLTGHSSFKTPEEMGKVVAGMAEAEHDEKSKQAMAHGNKYEPHARQWYEKHYNCKVKERGLCVPKWNLLIGASVDGEVFTQDGSSEGMIEIKCPVEMYNSIKQYMDAKSFGWEPCKNYHNHIFHTHYIQCQLGMAVLGKKWCDYIVYSTSDGQIFTQRIKFNPDFWQELYPQIGVAYSAYVKPWLQEGYPLCP